jgi:hypothetical protein
VTLLEDGSVIVGDPREDALGDAEIRACVVTLLEKTRFPAPAAGPVKVVYPFLFGGAEDGC